MWTKIKKRLITRKGDVEALGKATTLLLSLRPLKNKRRLFVLIEL